jgi:hypothetical protein
MEFPDGFFKKEVQCVIKALYLGMTIRKTTGTTCGRMASCADILRVSEMIAMLWSYGG